MKRLFIFLISAILIDTLSFGQKSNPEIICSNDTLVVKPHISMKLNPFLTDSANLQPYRIVQCRSRSLLGFRMEFAISRYYYGDKTAEWIGQHGGPNFNFILAIDKLNLGFRFKPWTINPKQEIEFDGQILPENAKLNNIRLDYYAGYSFDFDKLISIEPYLGYNQTTFLVINEDEINQKFSFNKTGGLIIGSTINKYFKLKNYEYISVFGTAGYGFVNYSKVHSNLDNGYFEWNLGVAYKGFAIKRTNKRIEE